jgi:hypothetical protein
LGYPIYFPEVVVGHQVTGWVMRCIDDHRSCIGAQITSQVVYIQRPIILLVGLPERYFTADAVGHLDEGLVTRRMHDDMVASPEDGVHKQEDGFLSAAVNQYLVRVDSRVYPGNLLPKFWRALRLSVS